MADLKTIHYFSRLDTNWNYVHSIFCNYDAIPEGPAQSGGSQKRKERRNKRERFHR